jgi:hypothetical protein
VVTRSLTVSVAFTASVSTSERWGKDHAQDCCFIARAVRSGVGSLSATAQMGMTGVGGGGFGGGGGRSIAFNATDAEANESCGYPSGACNVTLNISPGLQVVGIAGEFTGSTISGITLDGVPLTKATGTGLLVLITMTNFGTASSRQVVPKRLRLRYPLGPRCLPCTLRSACYLIIVPAHPELGAITR